MTQIPKKLAASRLNLLAGGLDQGGAIVELVGTVETVSFLKDKLALESTVKNREGVRVALQANQSDGFAVKRIFVLWIRCENYRVIGVVVRSGR